MQTEMIGNRTRTEVAGVSLDGLVKTFAAPAGPVHAVRGVDLAVAPGETVALLGPNGAGKSTLIDMLLGLLPPDAGTVSLFGRAPDRAIQAGAVGAMLQSGGLIRVALGPRADRDDGLALPGPAAGRRGAAADRDRAVRRPPHREAVGWADAARPLRDGPRQQPRPAGARRADGRARRRGAPRVLGDHARDRRARPHGALRHALPRGGRRLRRPRRGDGRRQDRRRRPADGDQGDGRDAHDPRDAPGGRPRRARSAVRRELGRAPRQLVPAALLRLRQRDPRAARRLPGRARHRDQRRRARGGVPRAHRRTTTRRRRRR